MLACLLHLVWLLDPGTHYVAKIGLELRILLLRLPTCLDYGQTAHAGPLLSFVCMLGFGVCVYVACTCTCACGDGL